MCGAFEKQQLKVCGEQKSSWSPLTSSAKYLESRKATWRLAEIQDTGLPGASATAGDPDYKFPLSLCSP